MFVEGNADLTQAELIGHHNPARVLREDYSEDNFVDGPLLEAMREGGFLYIEEFNRAPEDTLNTLLTAMAERQVAVPRAGTVTAKPTFRVIASMNPYDNVGTTRLSTSVHDRLCRRAITYQDAESSGGSPLSAPRCPPGPGALHPAGRRRGRGDPGHPRAPGCPAGQQRARRHRHDPDRGAAPGLAGVAQFQHGSNEDESYPDVVFDAMVVALSGRIFLDETVELPPEAVLRQIWEDHFILNPAAAAPG